MPLQDLKVVNSYLKSCFLIFPNYNLGHGLMEMAYNEYVNEYYAKIGEAGTGAGVGPGEGPGAPGTEQAAGTLGGWTQGGEGTGALTVGLGLGRGRRARGW